MGWKRGTWPTHCGKFGFFLTAMEGQESGQWPSQVSSALHHSAPPERVGTHSSRVLRTRQCALGTTLGLLQSRVSPQRPETGANRQNGRVLAPLRMSRVPSGVIRGKR